MKRIVGICFYFLFALNVSPVAANPLSFSNGDFTISWKTISDEIEFTASGKTVGWIAFGISNEASRMRNIDLFIGRYQNSVTTGEDYYATSQSGPPKDTKQDFTVVSGNENNGRTTITFKRKLDTGDTTKDIKIVPGSKYYLAWAYGDDDVFGYHSARGYSQSKVELVGLPSSSPVPSSSSPLKSSSHVTPSTSTAQMTSTPVPQSSTTVKLTSKSVMTSSLNPSQSKTSFITPTSTSMVVSSSITSPTAIVTISTFSFRNGTFNVSWAHDPSTKEIIFNLSVRASGWIGLGISDVNRGMQDMDIVVAWVDSSGNSHIQDMYSKSTGKPTSDAQQDARLVRGGEVNGTTTIEFRKKIQTGDEKDDIQLQPGKEYYVAWSYHSTSDAFSIHTHRGYSNHRVVMVSAGDVPTSGTQTTPMTTSSTASAGRSSLEITTCIVVLITMALFS